MVKINERLFNATVNYHAGDCGADIEVTIPDAENLTDEDIVAIKNAKEFDEIESYHGSSDVVGTYALVNWLSVERARNGTKFRWQTYRTTELDQLRQDNEDLTEALLELAAIIGGEE